MLCSPSLLGAAHSALCSVSAIEDQDLVFGSGLLFLFSVLVENKVCWSSAFGTFLT